MPNDKIEVENIHTPGKTNRLNAAKYNAMKDAMLAVMTNDAPGMTAKEIKQAALPHLLQECERSASKR